MSPTRQTCVGCLGTHFSLDREWEELTLAHFQDLWIPRDVPYCTHAALFAFFCSMVLSSLGVVSRVEGLREGGRYTAFSGRREVAKQRANRLGVHGSL